MGNPWMDVVTKVKKNNPNLTFKQILIKSKELYKKVKKPNNKQTQKKKRKKKKKAAKTKKINKRKKKGKKS
jgi:hypothetical protein